MDPITVAFTGHRPRRLGGFDLNNPIKLKVKEELLQVLRALNVTHAFSGMAQGFDTWAVEACIDRGLPYTAVIPFHGFEKMWPDQAQRDFHRLVAGSDSPPIYVSDPTTGLNVPTMLQLRNERLVDLGDRLIACWDGVEEGGTWNTIRFARMMGTPITYIDGWKS